MTGVVVDHLVVAARTLDEGDRWCEAHFGVAAGPGGRHALMGTHNRLLAIGSPAFAEAYLEIIAIDPDAAPPGRARWYGLDEVDLSDGPRLVHWVARCTDIEARLAALGAAGIDAGRVLAVSRETPRGRLDWRLTVRDDGRLSHGGALPTLIDWGTSRHPAADLPARGVALLRLGLRGVPPAAASQLGLHPEAGAGPAISATFDTPRGPLTLTSDE